MPKRKPKHNVVTAALLSVIASSVAVTVAMTNAEGDQTRAVVSYYGTSAGYQGVSYPYAPGSYQPEGKSVIVDPPKPVLTKAQLNRKIKQLKRTITSVHKRLMVAEKKVETLERTIETSSGDTSELIASLARLRASRDVLENQLATLENDFANYSLQLKDAK